MKVLIATGIYPPDIGGPATYTKFLERHLPQHGIEYVVVSFSGVRKYPKIIRHILYISILMWKGISADIVYALDTISVGVPALLMSTILGKTLYLRVPGDYAWEQGQQRFGITCTLDEYLVSKVRPWTVRMLAWLQYRVARRATKIIVPSDYMKGVVQQWGIPPHKIFRVYSALNPIEVLHSKEDLRSRFGYQGFVVTTAGRLTPWKGMDALIEAVVALHDREVAITLEIIGDGTQREKLAQLIQNKHAEPYIHLRGIMHKQELAERIKSSDVFVLNTSYEGLSHQLIEVMDIGVPIITTPVGGNVELVSDGHEGLLVPFNDQERIMDALTKIRIDTQLGAGLVIRAHEKVKLFREDTVIPEIVKLFT